MNHPYSNPVQHTEGQEQCRAFSFFTAQENELTGDFGPNPKGLITDGKCVLLVKTVVKMPKNHIHGTLREGAGLVWSVASERPDSALSWGLASSAGQ